MKPEMNLTILINFNKNNYVIKYYTVFVFSRIIFVIYS